MGLQTSAGPFTTTARACHDCEQNCLRSLRYPHIGCHATKHSQMWLHAQEQAAHIRPTRIKQSYAYVRSQHTRETSVLLATVDIECGQKHIRMPRWKKHSDCK